MRLSLLFLLVQSGVAVAAPTANVQELVTRMQAFYEKTEDFTARFEQEYSYKTFKRKQKSKGTVTFKKPALMRWNYESGKTFVLAGEKIYAFDPEAMTLTKAHMGTHQLSASVTFLWGRGNLLEEFNITQKPCEKCAGVLLEMIPRVPDPRFQKIVLEVDSKTAQVRKSTVTDPDGSENAISFLDMKRNTKVPETFFRLSPPPGTTIQDFTTATPKK